jgi:hypothetical protein
MALDVITGALAVADDVLKVGLQKDAQLNAPAVVLAKQSAEVQKLKDAVNAAIKNGDLDEIRRLCA